MKSANQYIKGRLDGVKKMLMGVHQSGRSMSSSTKGSEREAFINAFLTEILPPQFRFGSGDITDQAGKKSGQLDIVIEFPYVPSIPIIAGKSPRLYLAEGVLAVIEVKSDISKQWEEVLRTADSLSKLKRNYGTGFTFGAAAGPRIPLYAVGYSGWRNHATVEKQLKDNPSVSGILVIEHGHFTGSYKYLERDNNKKIHEKYYSYTSKSSAMALWGLISCIHFGGSMITSTTKYVPESYDSTKA